MQYYGAQQEKYPAIWIIVLGFILFFPVGFFLLYRRLTCDKTDLMQRSRIQRNYGIGVCILGIIMFLGSSSPMSGCITIIAAFFFFWNSRKSKKLAIKYAQYLTQVVDNNLTRIDIIAQMTMLPPAIVQKDLHQMVVSGFFPGAYIDAGRNELILPGHVNNLQQTGSPFIAAPSSGPIFSSTVGTAAPAIVTVTCGNCGATNTITTGTACHCEYCGSPLSA